MAGPGGAGVTPEERDILRIIGKSWGWVLFFGIVTLILGVLVTIKPKDTVYAFAILLGIWLFVAGLFRIVMAIADHDDTGGTRWLMAFLGLLSVIVGILFLRHTDETVTTLAFLIGLFWVIGGIIEFFTAYTDVRVRRPRLEDRHGRAGLRRRHRDPGLAPPHPGCPGRHHGDLVDHLRGAGDRALTAAAPPGRDPGLSRLRPGSARSGPHPSRATAARARLTCSVVSGGCPRGCSVGASEQSSRSRWRSQALG